MSGMKILSAKSQDNTLLGLVVSVCVCVCCMGRVVCPGFGLTSGSADCFLSHYLHCYTYIHMYEFACGSTVCSMHYTLLCTCSMLPMNHLVVMNCCNRHELIFVTGSSSSQGTNGMFRPWPAVFPHNTTSMMLSGTVHGFIMLHKVQTF